MMRKFGQMLKGMVSSGEDEVEGQSKLYCLRRDLIAAIDENRDSSDIVRSLVEIDTDDFVKKYAVLDVKSLLQKNSQSLKNLESIVSGLSLIAKYAQILLKRDQPIKAIYLSNPHVQSKILPMDGHLHILAKLGYSQQIDATLNFPPGADLDHSLIVNLLADMLLFKAEMKYFLSGSHFYPQQIETLLPHHTLAELHQTDFSSTDFLDTAMQSLSLDKAKILSSNESSNYYSAQSGGSSNKDSSKEGTLPEEDKEEEEEDSGSKGPSEIVTLQDFAVEDVGASETTSLKTPSSGFKISCSLCNEEAQKLCTTCLNKVVCENCDAVWHSHPTRRNHTTVRIADVDLTAIPSHQGEIVTPYGIIAQTDNPGAIISQKIQAAALSRKSCDTADVGPAEEKNGNVPDFGSIMSGNLDAFADDKAKNSPSIKTRGGSKDGEIHNQGNYQEERGLGAHQVPQQQHHYYHRQGEHSHQQFVPLPLQHFPQVSRGSDNNDVEGPRYQQHFQQPQHFSPTSTPFPMQQPLVSSAPQYVTSMAQPLLSHSTPNAQGQPIEPVLMQGQPTHPGQGHVPSVPNSHSQSSKPNVPGHYVGMISPTPYRLPHSQGQDQSHVQPLHLQMPSPSTFHSIGASNFNQSSPTPEQYCYSFQQQPKQEPQQDLFKYPELIPVYNLNTRQWRYEPPAPRQPLTPGGEPQRWYNNHNQGNMADSFKGTLHSMVGPMQTKNSRNLTSQDHHQMLHQSQQYNLPPGNLQNASDEEETFVQYLNRPHMMTSSQSSSMVNVPYRGPQMQSSFAPKQSQTYPLLSNVASPVSPNEEQSRLHHSQQQLCQPKLGKQFRTSQPSSALTASSSPAARIIQRIKSEPLSFQKTLFSFKIKELTAEIEDLGSEMDELLLDDGEASALEIQMKMRSKKELLKTKKELEKYLNEIDCPDDNTEVFYPPNNPCLGQKHLPVSPAEKLKAGIRRTPTKEFPEAHIESSKFRPKESDAQAELHYPFLSNFSGTAESTTDNVSNKELLSNQGIEPPQLSLKADKLSPKSSSKLKWQCQHCTFLNDEDALCCIICNKTTDQKQYTPEDSDNSEPSANLLGGETNLQNDDFVAEVVKNRALSMQKEEEKMMAEKKKAWAEYGKESQKVSQGTTGKQFTNSVNDMADKASASSTPIDKEGGAFFVPAGGFSDMPGRGAGSGLDNSSHSSSPANASLALERLKAANACDSLKRDGEMLVGFMKEADIAGYPVDAVPIALYYCEAQTSAVLEWLANHWEKNLKLIMTEVANIVATREQNDIGQLSKTEAELACIECQGNLKHAVDKCAQKREDLFNHLNTIDNYPREEILQAMYNQRGDKEKAEQELVCTKLNGFVERIWTKGDTYQNILYPAVMVSAAASAGGENCVSKSSSALEQDTFRQLITDMAIDTDRRIRMIMVEGKLKSWGRGEMVIDILDKGQCNDHVDLDDIVEAVRNCQDRKSALSFLQHECQICFDMFPMGKIRILRFCQCKMCVGCMKGYFKVAIKEKHVRHWICPLCDLPNMNDEDESSDHINMLQMLLSPVVTPELMSLFEDKVRDFSLQKDPAFRWCAHCGNGFLAENNGPGPMTCNSCNKMTCFTCKRMWEPQHQGVSCENFEKWKIENDPNNQAIGLARHLEESGIDCPKCNMRYSLAKGGCMHFKCPQCGHEFCSGCYESFNHQGVCKKYKMCQSLGFHCHHPRDCFSFLRDRTVNELQQLLERNKVPYNTQVPEDQEDKEHCPVMEQKEDGLQRKDEKCGKDVAVHMAGLCLPHYKEYLTSLINKHALDPVQLMNLKEMLALLKRYDLNMASRDPAEGDQAFNDRLRKMIQERLPLNRKKLDQ